MKRTGFKPQWPEKAVRAMSPAPSGKPDTSRFKAMRTVSQEVTACPKENPLRSEEYRRLVAALPCKGCGVHGHSQAAHPNTGKGMAAKTDDRLCFPLCCARIGAAGCHALFDQGALFSKAVRREIEPVWGADTRRAIVAAGKWPQGLPMWEETEGETV